LTVWDPPGEDLDHLPAEFQLGAMGRIGRRALGRLQSLAGRAARWAIGLTTPAFADI